MTVIELLMPKRRRKRAASGLSAVWQKCDAAGRLPGRYGQRFVYRHNTDLVGYPGGIGFGQEEPERLARRLVRQVECTVVHGNKHSGPASRKAFTTSAGSLWFGCMNHRGS